MNTRVITLYTVCELDEYSCVETLYIVCELDEFSCVETLYICVGIR